MGLQGWGGREAVRAFFILATTRLMDISFPAISGPSALGSPGAVRNTRLILRPEEPEFINTDPQGAGMQVAV